MSKILLVEDNANAKLAYSIALKRFRFEVQTASDGQEAMESFRKKRTDLVITDFKMPRLDGQQLALRVHQLEPNVPVLMISAFEVSEIENKVAGEDGMYFLAKPFSTVQLINTVNRILHANKTTGD